MTNLEFLRHASPVNVAKFLILWQDYDEPDDWDEAMRMMIHWLGESVDENHFDSIKID